MILQNPSSKPLQQDTADTQASTDQSPLVGQLRDVGPERVLFSLESLEFGHLLRRLGSVSLLLTSFILLVSADVSEESPVGEGRKQGERIKQVVGVEEEGVCEVDELVAEVAAESVLCKRMPIVASTEQQRGYSLGVSDNRPYPLSEKTLVTPLLVAGQLPVCQYFQSESS
jgi:hypothetical protein